MRQYIYRRDDGMEIRRGWWSPWLKLKGYSLVGMVDVKKETRDVKAK